MSDAYTTPMMDMLARLMAEGDSALAREIFDEADQYSRAMLDSIASIGHMMAGLTDDTPIDPTTEEWSAMGDSIRNLAVLGKGFYALTEQYRWRLINGDQPIRAGKDHAQR